jgi:hypothetical protein
MQKSITDEIRKCVQSISNEFEESKNGIFVYLETGELFTQTEYTKYLKGKLEKFKIELFGEINEISEEQGVENEQRIINKRSTKQIGKLNCRQRYDRGGAFCIMYKDSLNDFENIYKQLNATEKLVYYRLRDFIAYPTNCIVINDRIPSVKDLEPIIGLTERSIVTALSELERLELIKRKQYGHKKAIYFNPYFYASGKDLSIETLELFELIDCDNDKVNTYLDD